MSDKNKYLFVGLDIYLLLPNGRCKLKGGVYFDLKRAANQDSRRSGYGNDHFMRTQIEYNGTNK